MLVEAPAVMVGLRAQQTMMTFGYWLLDIGYLGGKQKIYN